MSRRALDRSPVGYRRKGRHFVMFRVGKAENGQVIEVLRLLHDAMDLPRHLPGGGLDSETRGDHSDAALLAV